MLFCSHKNENLKDMDMKRLITKMKLFVLGIILSQGVVWAQPGIPR